MRKLLLSATLAASALAVAAPASATFYAPVYAPVYAPPVYAPPGYAYGYQHNYGQVRALQVRVDYLQRQIAHLAQRRMISRAEYNGLREDSRELERRLHRRARNGLNPREFYNVQRSIARLEQKIAHEVRDGRQYRYRW